MDITIYTEEFMELQQNISAKDVEIAKLKEQVAQREEERDHWKTRALKAEEILNTEEALKVNMVIDSASDKEKSESTGVIILSVELLKAVLSKIHSLHIVSIVALILQKALHRKATAEESRQITDLVLLPELPSLRLTAEGDIERSEGQVIDLFP